MSIFPILFLILKSSQSLPNSLRNLVVDLSKGDLMERLKSCLNLAISKQAQCVRLIAGGPPQIMLPNQTIEGDGGADMTSEQLREIINATMPGRWFSSPSEVLDGSLNIGGPGVLLMRSRADGQLRIDFYFPSSGTMFQSDILEQKSRQAPPAVAPQVFPVAISIPSLSVPSQANPAAPVAVISIPPIPAMAISAIPAMAIPARPAMAIPIPAMPIPEIPVAPAPASSVRPAAAPVAEEGMFRVASAPRPQSAPAALAAQAVPLPIPQREHIAPPRMHAPMVVLPSPDEVAEINFSNEVAGEGQSSNGDNPIDDLLKEMVKLNASDLHLTIGQPIILRIHGEITRNSDEVITSDMMSRFLLPTFPKRNHKEFLEIQDTDYAYELMGIGRFRVNVYRDRNGVGAVLRHIPANILSAEKLGLSSAITKLCHLSKGLVLVTGPTGSGKSTTLAAMLDLINLTRKEHILTIEDPIEFVHPQKMCLVNQREVRKHTGSFGRALKAALREDPDVVLIGELRDLETIAIAIETAETGHLVFGTLHTTTAMSTVDRMIDQFPADRQAQIRTMLSSSLKGVVAQTLLKKKGGGRVAAHEILICNDAVSAIIREGKIQNLANHMMTNKADGNQLLNEALFKLIADGLVTPEDALFKSNDKNSFLISAKQKGIVFAA